MLERVGETGESIDVACAMWERVSKRAGASLSEWMSDSELFCEGINERANEQINERPSDRACGYLCGTD